MGAISRPSSVSQDGFRLQPEAASHPSVPPDLTPTSAVPTVLHKRTDELLRNAESLPPITWSNWYTEVRWFNIFVIVVTPLVALYGALTTHLETRTFWFSVFYYVFTMIGGLLNQFLGHVLSSNLVGDPKE